MLILSDHPGTESLPDIIQEFKLQGPPLGLRDVGLVDRFKQVLNPRLWESIYWLHPMPTIWVEWKQKASILDNQWRHFQASQSQAAPTRPAPSPFHTCPSPQTPFPLRTAAPMPLPPAQPMELDRLRPMRRDPRSGTCYNCNHPGVRSV